MKRVVAFVKKFLFTSGVEEKENVLATPSGFVPLPGIHYVPAADEPSLFSATPGVINSRWTAWYLRRNKAHGYKLMEATAVSIQRQLALEPPRTFAPGYLPALLVSYPLVISFEWVIWYKYEFNVSFEQAHEHARMLSYKE